MVKKEEKSDVPNIPKVNPDEFSQEEEENWQNEEYDRYYDEDFSDVEGQEKEEEIEPIGQEQKIKEQMLLADSRT